MKLCIKYRLNPSSEQEESLQKLGFYATKLYNTDNYIRREQWNETGKIPSWYNQKKLLKNNHWYKLLPSQTAQQICKNLQENYNSWFKLRKTDVDARPPLFRKKTRLSPLSFYQQFKIIGNTVSFSMSRKFKKETGIGKLIFDIKKWRDIKGEPKMCNILYQNNKWMLHVVYEIPEVKLKNNPETMGIDIGIINLATTTDTKDNSTIYSGREALAIQHYFNKEIAKVQSKTMEQHDKKTSKAISRMHIRKRRQINQIIHIVTKNIVKEAERNNIGTIVVGDIKNIRKGKHWHKKESQKLHSWGFSKLISQIEYKAKLSGIRFMKISERDTSKTCSSCGIIRKSNRKHRGLYKCKTCGNTMNADLNGARNILQKYLHQAGLPAMGSIGSVAEPMIWRCVNVAPA